MSSASGVLRTSVRSGVRLTVLRSTPAWAPASVKRPQVDRAADQRPLGIDPFMSTHGPAAKAFMLFDLAEYPLDHSPPASQLRGGVRLPHSGAHPLNRSGMRPDFYKAPGAHVFGTTRTNRTAINLTSVN